MTDTVEWLGPNGTVINLTDLRNTGYLLSGDGTDGDLFGAPASDIIADPAAIGGSTVRGTYTPPRIGTLALYIEGAIDTEFLTRWRTLVSAFTSTKRLGPGRLRITRPNGSAREIFAYFDDGLKAPPGNQRYLDSAVTLYCPDAYWRDTVATPLSRMYSVSSDLLSPYPSVSPSNTLGSTTLTNPGDADAYINWLISGPASSVIASRDDTGESWTLDIASTAHGPLAVGEQATVQTEPPAVRGPNGEIWTAALNWPAADLWPLPPGDTPITFQILGAAVGSEIAATFYPRYDTA